MFKQLFIVIIFIITCINPIYSQDMNEAIFSTKCTYEISDYSGQPFTPIMTLCQEKNNSKMYYHISNIADSSNESIVIWTGTLDQTMAIYDTLDTLIKMIEYNGKERIEDAIGNIFIIAAPIIEEHRGRYIRIMSENENFWGIISKQHLKNFKRVF